MSLSGKAAEGFFSSTFASTLPLATRSEDLGAAVATPCARRRRNSLKSRLCATMVWGAPPGPLGKGGGHWRRASVTAS